MVLMLIMGIMTVAGCAPIDPISIDPPYLQLPLSEPAPPPGKPGTRITGTIGAGPGTLELTDAAGDKAFVHVDKNGNFNGFVAKEHFEPVTSTLELNDRSKTTWTLQEGKWRPQTGLAGRTDTQSLKSGTGGGTGVLDYARSWGIREINFTGYGGGAFSGGNVDNRQTSALGGLGSFTENQNFGLFSSAFGKGGVGLVLNSFLGISDVVVEFSGTKFSDRARTVDANLDPISAGREATHSVSVSHAYNLAIGKRFTCAHFLGGTGGYYEVLVGGSAVKVENSLSILEAGNRQTFRHSTTLLAPYGSLNFGIPMWKFGPLRTDFTAGIDARYIHETGGSNQSALNLGYSNQTNGFFDINAHAGIRLAF